MSTTKERKFVYPGPAKCPHCRGFDTVAVHTDNARGIQHRRCRRAICRGVRWVVRGTPVPESPSFDCPHCDTSYKRKADLTKHIKTKHTEGETKDGPGTGKE